MSRTLLAFGSESGNAERLANQFAKRLLSNQPSSAPTSLIQGPLIPIPLNQVNCAELTDDDLLLIITSSFGDGEPPANAEDFLEHLPQTCSFRFAVFGLGDVSYPNFCGYSKAVDAALAQTGATRIACRVDADIYFDAFFDQWSEAITSYLNGDPTPATELKLQVAAYSDSAPYLARITRHERISPSALNVELDISGSGIQYAPGDLVYIYPQNDPYLQLALATWFETDISLLGDKDLRALPKPLLKAVARATGDAELAELLKFKNRAALQKYLYGLDILDLLEERDPGKRITLDQLAELLPAITPRAYSIASACANKLRLCMREVSYYHSDRKHLGLSSGFMAARTVGDKVPITVRPNPEFAFDADKPALMIGAGVGVAPFISYLEQQSQQDHSQTNILCFGEKHQKEDFLYGDFLSSCQATGTLNALITAYSRDQDQKYYVQDAMRANADALYGAIQSGAVIYVCGNKSHLGEAVNDALQDIFICAGKQSHEEASAMMRELEIARRIRRDLF